MNRKKPQFFTGRLYLVSYLAEHGIRPADKKPSPFNDGETLFIYDGTEELAMLAKKFFDAFKIPYSRSLSFLLHSVEGNDDGKES